MGSGGGDADVTGGLVAGGDYGGWRMADEGRRYQMWEYGLLQLYHMHRPYSPQACSPFTMLKIHKKHQIVQKVLEINIYNKMI